MALTHYELQLHFTHELTIFMLVSLAHMLDMSISKTEVETITQLPDWVSMIIM